MKKMPSERQCAYLHNGNGGREGEKGAERQRAQAELNHCRHCVLLYWVTAPAGPFSSVAKIKTGGIPIKSEIPWNCQEKLRHQRAPFGPKFISTSQEKLDFNQRNGKALTRIQKREPHGTECARHGRTASQEGAWTSCRVTGSVLTCEVRVRFSSTLARAPQGPAGGSVGRTSTKEREQASAWQQDSAPGASENAMRTWPCTPQGRVPGRVTCVIRSAQSKRKSQLVLGAMGKKG